MKHILPTETVNKVLAYLSSKTYSEVVLLIEEVKKNAEQYVESQSNPTPPVSNDFQDDYLNPKTKRSNQ